MSDWIAQAAAQAANDLPQEAPPLPEVVPGRVLHIDGDLLAYWAGGSEDTTVAESRGRAISKINALRDQAGAETVVLHLTAPHSSKGDRFIIATLKPYQGHRKSGRRPKNWEYLRNWLSGYEGGLFRPKMWSSREADDGVALCAYDSIKKGKGLVAIASGDKDFRMIPGIHVNWNTYEVTTVPHGAYDIVGTDGKQYGLRWFFQQLLQGDPADNIPGLPRYNGKPVGEVTADKLLAGTTCADSAYRTVLSCYSEHYGDEARTRLTEQAMLLWLRTDAAADPGDFTTLLSDPGLRPCVEAVKQRIAEAYAEAQKYTGQATTH